jgi:hypothetical protein
MAAAGYTNSQLAAKIVEGCLAHIAGNLQTKLPIQPIVVADLDRAMAGLQKGGQTHFYPLGESGVFVDFNGSVATIGYVKGDYERGLDALETAMKAKHRVKQLKDDARGAPKQRVRSYEVELGGKRLAHVIAEYAERGAQEERFFVRVVAQVRK